MARSAKIGSLRVDLGLNSAQFSKGLDNARKRLGKVGRSMQNVGRSMSLGLSAPIAAFGGLALRTAGNFEQAMNRVQAVSGATGDQLEGLAAQAKELGSTTQFSASQAADAMGFLAQAGFDVEEIMGALPGTLQLAASAQIELGQAADTVSNILSGYGKEVSELAEVNDVLVATFTKTNTDLTQLGEAFKVAGPVAASAGVQFEETAAAIGLMGNAGIQASMAGTSLRGAIAKMLNPSKEAASVMQEAGLSFTDAAGRLKPLEDILRQLEPVAEDTGLFMQIFGQRAGPAMAALVSQGSDALRELTGDLEASGGTAEKIAESQMKGLNGAMRELRSAFEGLQLAIADSGLIEFATNAVQKLTAFVQKLNETNPAILKWGTVIAGIGIAIGPVLIALGALTIAIGALASPIGAAVVAIGAVAAAVAAFWEDLKALDETLTALVTGAWQLYLDAVAAAEEAILGFLGDAWQSLVDAFNGVVDQVKTVARAWWSLNEAALDAVGGMVEGVVAWLADKLEPALDALLAPIRAVAGAFDWLRDTVVGNSIVPEMVDAVIDEFVRMTDGMTGEAQVATAGVGRQFSGMRTSLEGSVSGLGSRVSSEFGGIANTITGPFKDALSEGELNFTSFKDSLISVGERLRDRMLQEIFKPIEDAIANLFDSGGGGFFGNLFSSLFSGGGGGTQTIKAAPHLGLGGSFAHGGVPPVGKFSLVGENGPELVRFGSTARVFSNAESRQMVGASGGRGVRDVTFGDTNVNITQPGATPEQINRIMAEHRKQWMRDLIELNEDDPETLHT